MKLKDQPKKLKTGQEVDGCSAGRILYYLQYSIYLATMLKHPKVASLGQNDIIQYSISF